jgi:cytidine deaminase
MQLEFQSLIKAACEVRLHAYAPYSRFPVGAALLGADGEVVTGCNVENLSYGLTLCAERSAIVAAVARGIRVFRGIAVCADTRQPISPCGACRQVLAEFGDFPVFLSTVAGQIVETSVGALLPRAKTGILDHE